MVKNHFCTPPIYARAAKLAIGGRFDFDPCGSETCPAMATNSQIGRSGLLVKWFGNVYVNPPWGYDYKNEGLELGKWLIKAQESILNKDAQSIVMYVPAYPCSSWWRLHVHERFSVCYLKSPSLARFVHRDGRTEDIDVALLHIGRWVEQDLFVDKLQKMGTVIRGDDN